MDNYGNIQIATITDGECDLAVAKEMPLTVYINGGHYATVMMSPGLEKEFIIGHLYSEGIIRSIKEITFLDIDGNTVEVNLNKKSLVFPGKIILSGCGGASNYVGRELLPIITSEIKIPKEAIISGVKEALNSELYRKTRGMHKCALFNLDALLGSTEDIGRHNALDKVIGKALIQQHQLNRTFIALTGRISAEMILKCSRSGIPAIASKTSVTSLALEFARITGLTVIGFATTNTIRVYTNDFRVSQ